ncbi:zf-C3HC-domain-containing protein [Sistotremastrum niveocremeum HHB9708]|uniref:Zf-C3HC-domain-containing protein n=1 Tax=Sistotremastrum niveocremeum HHB9708 TaxID=1314777 RepID=A0A164TTY5_9AGAM|nr:zf-C3HC-domain-containing protein [Sistotremastrum niveocremeum HHB9708]
MSETQVEVPQQPPPAITKRKLDDAISALDDAVRPRSERPRDAKRRPLSIYSTLAKYGINTSNSPSSIKTFKRSLARLIDRKPTSSKPMPPPSDISQEIDLVAQYRPSSTDALLARLQTYKLSTYSNKPDSVNPVAAAKCGWVNEGKDRLVCKICGSSWVLASVAGMSKDAAATLLAKQASALIDEHKEGCPWRSKQSDDSVYRISLSSPTSMANKLLETARLIDPHMEDVQIHHPFTAPQIHNLMHIITAVNESSQTQSSPPSSSITSESVAPHSTLMNDQPVQPSSLPPPSEAAMLASLCGWSLAPHVPTSSSSRPRLSSSLSTSSSRIGSPIPLSRSSSRASSVAPGYDGMQIDRSFSSISGVGESKGKQKAAYLQCEMCQRRIGLSLYTKPPAPSLPSPTIQNASHQENGAVHAAQNGETSNSAESSQPVNASSTPSASETRPARTQLSRTFDLVREHRSFCAWVTKSTTLPKPPIFRHPSASSLSPAIEVSVNVKEKESLDESQTEEKMEGWRAYLTTVLKRGIGESVRRQANGLPPIRVSRSSSTLALNSNQSQDQRPGEGTDVMDVDTDDALSVVQGLVRGAKDRQGSVDLLRYVKGVLG